MFVLTAQMRKLSFREVKLLTKCDTLGVGGAEIQSPVWKIWKIPVLSAILNFLNQIILKVMLSGRNVGRRGWVCLSERGQGDILK
jgi:hypothetical protein